MPAKKKITREQIIDAALCIASECGLDDVNTFTLTQKLGCSTQPIYLSFKNMGELKSAVIDKIYDVYNGYLAAEVKSGKYPVYKAYGMGYIKFAKDESKLFSVLFMNERCGRDDSDLGEIYNVISENTGLDIQRAKLFHLENWIYVHGIATMLATKHIEFTEDRISALITDMYEGLKGRFCTRK